MVTVKRIKEILDSLHEDFTVSFRKWEHVSSEELSRRKYPMPNRVSLKLQDKFQKPNDMGGAIRTFVFEDDDDDDLLMTKEETIKFFTDGLEDTDHVEIRLSVEDTPGHIDHIGLDVEHGDTGWSDRVDILEFEEEK